MPMFCLLSLQFNLIFDQWSVLECFAAITPMIFFRNFLACARLKNYGKKDMEDFPGFCKCYAKHWAIVIISFECQT